MTDTPKKATKGIGIGKAALPSTEAGRAETLAILAFSKSDTIDRTLWGPGPWDGEPDRLEWRSHGLPCLLQRNGLGAWCGYVAVPPGHPLHGVQYHEADISANVGLTFSGIRGRRPDNAHLYWFGFDAAHDKDLVPGLKELLSFLYQHNGAQYRDLAYMTRQTEALALELFRKGLLTPEVMLKDLLSQLGRRPGEVASEVAQGLKDAIGSFAPASPWSLLTDAIKDDIELHRRYYSYRWDQLYAHKPALSFDDWRAKEEGEK